MTNFETLYTQSAIGKTLDSYGFSPEEKREFLSELSDNYNGENAPAPLRYIIRAEPDATLGTVLSRARRARALTQNETAAALDICPATMSKYENGDVMPRADTLVRMADMLNITPGTAFRAIREQMKKGGPAA